MATINRESIGLLNEKITVRVGKEDYLSSFEKSLKNYSKNANIPGFRKGMVPTGMIKKMHGQAVFTDEVLKTVEKQLNEYMSNEKLEIFAQPLPLEENDARSIDMNNPAEYAFAFEVGLKPEFTIADLSESQVKRYRVMVTEEMIDQETERLQVRHGTMKDLDSVNGDENILTLTFIESDETGTPVESGIEKNISILVKYFSENLRPSLTGKKSGDEIIIRLPDAFGEKEREWIVQQLGLNKEESSGAEKFFKLIITKVAYMDKAELNESFFKVAYPGKEINSIEELRNASKEEIQNYWDSESRNHLQHEIYHTLVDNTNIEFPETFLKRWMQNGTDKPKTSDEVEKEFPVFINQLKWTLITDKLVTENNIEVSPDELKNFARQQLFGYMGMNAMDEEQPWISEYINRMMHDKKFVDDAYHRIQTDKMFNWIETNSTISEDPIAADDFNKLIQEHKHHHHA